MDTKWRLDSPPSANPPHHARGIQEYHAEKRAAGWSRTTPYYVAETLFSPWVLPVVLRTGGEENREKKIWGPRVRLLMGFSEIKISFSPRVFRMWSALGVYVARARKLPRQSFSVSFFSIFPLSFLLESVKSLKRGCT